MFERVLFISLDLALQIVVFVCLTGFCQFLEDAPVLLILIQGIPFFLQFGDALHDFLNVFLEAIPEHGEVGDARVDGF